MRVLLLTDEMLPGGVSRHVVLLANGLKRRGMNVTVAATPGEFRKYLHSEIVFFPITLLKENSYTKRIFGFPNSYIGLSKFIKSKDCDIIHTHKRYSDVLGRILARSNHIPHIATCHNTFSTGKVYSIFGEYTIAVSKAIERMLIQRFHKKQNTISTIYNGIESLDHYAKLKVSDLKYKYGIKEKFKVIVCVAQFLEAKDHITLLNALEIIKKHRQSEPFYCILVGHGPLYTKLQKFVFEHHLEHIVKFLPGTINIEEIFNISDFCVLPSIREGGVPYVIMESASLQKPYIASSVGGIPEFINHFENGLLVPPQNSIKMAEAIEFFLDHPEEVLRMGKNAWEYFQKNHSSDAFVDKTIGVYEKQLRESHYH